MIKKNSTISAAQREAALIHIEEGKRFLAGEDTVHARRAFRIATRLDPLNAQAWQLLAELAEGSEQDQYFQKARDALAYQEASRARGVQRLLQRPRLAFALVAATVVVILVASAALLGAVFFFDRSMGGLYKAGLDTGAQALKASQGGQIALQGATFVVPPDALLEDADFSLKVLSDRPEASEDPSLVAVGLPVQIETNTTYLREACWAMLRYDRSRLPLGVSEESLQLARWDGEHWVFLNSAIDQQEQQVTARVTHFSSPVLQIFGRSSGAVLSKTSSLSDADRFFTQGEFEKAASLYQELVDQQAPEQRAELTGIKESQYWLAYYRLGFSQYKMGLYNQAGKTLYTLLKEAYSVRPELFAKDGSGPAMALSALQSWYPLGVGTSSLLHDEPVMAKIPDQAYTTEAEDSVYTLDAVTAFDTLPVEIRSHLQSFEEHYGGKEAVVTDSRVDVLVVSSQAQASSQQFLDVYMREIGPAFADTMVRNEAVGEALDIFQDNLGQYVDQFLKEDAPTSAYLVSQPVPEDPSQHAPLVLLRIQRQWQVTRPDGTPGQFYGQYLLALAPSDLEVGRRLEPTRYTDRGLRFFTGRLTGLDIAYNWFVLAEYVTDNITSDQGGGRAVSAAMISAGGSHTCAVSGGGVQCWGSNKYGQLGTGALDQDFSSYPRTVSGLSNIAAVVTGENHSCSLSSLGAVKCWGRNDSGQVGDGTNTVQPYPVDVKGLSSGIVALSAGQNHTCALHENGRVWCWGSNFNGQLGDGQPNGVLNASNQPVRVEGLEQVTALAAGGSHTCGVQNGGAMYCWGANGRSQLGGQVQGDQHKPVVVSGLQNVEQIGAGLEHTCAVSAGMVFCWGANAAGQVGTGSQQVTSSPAPVPGLDGKALRLAVGQNHTCALVEPGLVRCWGANASGQLGVGVEVGNSTRPVTTAALAEAGLKAVGISAGASHTCAMLDNGFIRCWGANAAGQLGGGISEETASVLVIGFGGRGPNDPLGELAVEPADEGKIELGQAVTVAAREVKAVGEQNAVTEVAFFASVNSGEWQELARQQPVDGQSSIVWETAGKELNTSVSFKIEIRDTFGNITALGSRQYTLADSIKPASGDLRITTARRGTAPESDGNQIEMGDWVTIRVENAADNQNGSGIEYVTFRVIEQGITVKLISLSVQPYQTDWPVPVNTQKGLGDKVQFTAEVTDKAKNILPLSSGVYTLVDRTDPSASDALEVTPAQTGADCGEKCIEYGTAVSISLSDVTDNKLGSGLASVKLEVTAGGSQIGSAEMTGSGGRYEGQWTAKFDTYRAYTDVTFTAIVTDKAGNDIPVSKTGFAIKDTIKPVCTGLNVEDTDQAGKNIVLNGESVKFTFTTGQDTGSPIRYFVEGLNADGYEKPEFSEKITVPGDGDKTYQSSVKDAAGNEGTCPASTSLKLNAKQPSAELPAGPIKETDEIVITFDEKMKASPAEVTVTHSGRTIPAGHWKDGDARTYTIPAPANGWQGGGSLKVTIEPAGFNDESGSPLSGRKEQTYTVVDAEPSLSPASLTAKNPITITFSEAVTADAGWATLVGCPVDVTMPEESIDTLTKQVSLSISNIRRLDADTCFIHIDGSKIYDDDLPEKGPSPSLTQDLHFYVSFLEFQNSLPLPWNEVRLLFNGKVTAESGWASLPGACSGVTLNAARQSTAANTLAMTFDTGSLVAPKDCTFTIDQSKIHGPGSSEIAWDDLTAPLSWSFSGRPTLDQGGTALTTSAFTLSFSREVTLKPDRGTDWAAMSCSPTGPTLALTPTLGVTLSAAPAGTCTITVDFDAFDNTSAPGPYGENRVYVTQQPQVTGYTQDGNSITVTFSKNVTTDSDWAVWDNSVVSCPAGITLSAPQQSSGSTHTLTINPGALTTEDVPACFIGLAAARIHDAALPTVNITAFGSLTYNLPAPAAP